MNKIDLNIIDLSHLFYDEEEIPIFGDQETKIKSFPDYDSYLAAIPSFEGDEVCLVVDEDRIYYNGETKSDFSNDFSNDFNLDF